MPLHLEPETFSRLLQSVGSRSGARPFSPIEVATAIEQAVASGHSPKEIAEALHLEGTTMIGRFRRLLTLPADVRLVTDWGSSRATISFTSAYEISGLNAAEEQLEACKAALEQGLTSAELRSAVQLRKRGTSSISGAILAVLNGRPTIIRRHLIVGGISEHTLQLRLASMTQLERDSLLMEVVSKRYHLPVGADVSGRLAPDRFTLSCSEAVGNHIVKDPEGFELSIAEALSARLKVSPG